MGTPRILRLGDVTRLTGLSKATIYRQIHAGTFPRPVKLGPRAVGWFANEVQDWLERRPRTGVEDQLSKTGPAVCTVPPRRASHRQAVAAD